MTTKSISSPRINKRTRFSLWDCLWDISEGKDVVGLSVCPKLGVFGAKLRFFQVADHFRCEVGALFLGGFQKLHAPLIEFGAIAFVRQEDFAGIDDMEGVGEPDGLYCVPSGWFNVQLVSPA